MHYIDFDNTLYETGKLTKDILSGLTTTIASQANISEESVLEHIHSSFNSTVANFFTFAKNLSAKYHVDYRLLETVINTAILTNGKNYVFPDALKFIKDLKAAGETICILTYVSSKNNLSQQGLKLMGSGILTHVDEVYTTTRYKHELNLDFENSTFIDDDPRDLEGFYSCGARKIIRIKKPNNEKRTSKKLAIPEELPTYTSFKDIPLPEKKISDKSINE